MLCTIIIIIIINMMQLCTREPHQYETLLLNKAYKKLKKRN